LWVTRHPERKTADRVVPPTPRDAHLLRHETKCFIQHTNYYLQATAVVKQELPDLGHEILPRLPFMQIRKVIPP